jgi:hypothetical protein
MLQSQNCVDPALQDISKENKADGFPLQPLVLVIGPVKEPESYYVLTNNVKNKLTDITSAIDSCFKIYFATNAVYPVHAERELYRRGCIFKGIFMTLRLVTI